MGDYGCAWTNMPRRHLLAKWICNGVLLVIALGLLSISLLNYFNPPPPPIRCQGTVAVDADILHKFTGDTVSTSHLLLVAFGVPLIQIVVTEVLHARYSQLNPLEPIPWKNGLPDAGKWFRDYVYGMIFLLILNDICKNIMNAPRPHFVDSCKPNFTAGNCTNGWVEDYVCDNPNISTWKLAEAHKSFPSGHAAVGMYSAVFMVLYQHNRLSVRRHGAIVILWCHLAWLAWGVFCALSRVADFRHHLVDITVGGVFGVCGALFTVRFLSHGFRKIHQLDIYEHQGNYPTPGNRTVNGSATFIEGLPSPPNMHTSISMPAELNGALANAKGPPKVLPQRPSLRRLLSSNSTVTQMTDIREDRELQPI